jgi:predicted dehydrogenase
MAQDAAQESGREVQIAVLGTGAIAQVVHLPTLAQMHGVRTKGVCDVDFNKATALARRFNIPTVYRRDEEVFAAPDVDGVVICSPSHLHEGQAIAALQGGKHVLVEKPLSLTAEGAKRVIDAARAADRRVMVALNGRYRADARSVRTFVTNGELGQVFLLRAGQLNRKVRLLRPTWRHRRRTSGGGALMDLGVQVLDLCMWMLDYPKVRRIICQTHPGEGMEVEDTAAILLETEAGASIAVEVSWSLLGARDRQYLHLLATRGSASLVPLAVHKELEHGLVDVTPQIPPGRWNVYTATYRDQLEHFAAVVAGKRDCVPPTEQIQLMELIALAYRSAERGEEVRVED